MPDDEKETGIDESHATDSEPSPEAPPYNYARRKRTILLMLLGWAAVAGSLGVILEADRLLDVIIGLPLIFMYVAWCHVDAGERRFRINKWMMLGLIFFFYFAFPIYIFCTRGLAGFKTLGWTLLFAIAMCFCAIGGAIATAVPVEFFRMLRDG